jgi:hypothetical protein
MQGWCETHCMAHPHGTSGGACCLLLAAHGGCVLLLLLLLCQAGTPARAHRVRRTKVIMCGCFVPFTRRSSSAALPSRSSIWDRRSRDQRRSPTSKPSSNTVLRYGACAFHLLTRDVLKMAVVGCSVLPVCAIDQSTGFLLPDQKG